MIFINDRSPSATRRVGKTTVLFLFVVGVMVLCAAPALALENLNGSARLSGIQQQISDIEMKSLDQQYAVNYRRVLLPYLQARFALSYHDLQSRQDSSADTWHGELQPTGDLGWVNPFFRLGVNYRYREVRDFLPTNESLSRSAGASLTTRFLNLPQSELRYDWSRNSSGSGFLPLNTEERRFQYSNNFYYKIAGYYYSYTHRDFDNLSANSGYRQQQHVLRLDYSQILLRDKLRLSAGYLFNYNRREETGPNALPIVQIPAVVGLYAHDDTPELGALDTLAALIDNNVDAATVPPIEIGGAFTGQNIGLDLGLPRQVNLIFVYVDTLSDEALDWTVYTSSDNLTWSALSLGAVSLFNLTFRRYEMSFTPTTARYFKVVNSGVNEYPEVRVTEIQAFLSSPESQNVPSRSENHRVNLNAAYQMHRNWSLGLDAAYGSLIEDQTSQERQEANLSGTASYHPSLRFSAVARAQHSLTDYSSDLIPLQETDTYSLIFSSNPLQTLEASLSGSHVETREDGQQIQKTNSTLLHASALLIPGLSAIAEAGFSHDDRPDVNLATDTWNYRLSADATPYQSLNLVLNYGLRIYDSNQAGVSGTRNDLEGRFNYRLTSALALRGGAAYAREQGSESLDQDYALSWNMTERISSSLSARLQNTGSLYKTRTLSVQSTYVFSNLTSAFFTYSFSRIEQQQQVEETTSYQLGFYTGF